MDESSGKSAFSIRLTFGVRNRNLMRAFQPRFVIRAEWSKFVHAHPRRAPWKVKLLTLLRMRHEGRWISPQVQAAGPTPTLLPLANRKPSQTPSRSPQPPSQQTKSYRKHLEDRAAGRETLCPEEERVFRITGVSQELGEGRSCLTVLLWVPTSC